MRKLKLLFGAAVALVAMDSGASATAVTTDQWYIFGFGSAPGAAAAGCVEQYGNCDLGFVSGQIDSGSPAWTITAPIGGLTLIVTDHSLPVDRFEIFDSASSLGQTSAPAGDGSSNCGFDSAACLANPAFSHGTFFLAEGSHSLTINVTENPIGPGTGGFRLEAAAAVPEPITLTILGLGLAGLGIMRRHRAA